MAEPYGQEVCEELWADDPNKGFCGAFSPETASIKKTEDGIVVSGRWAWASVQAAPADATNLIDSAELQLVPVGKVPGRSRGGGCESDDGRAWARPDGHGTRFWVSADRDAASADYCRGQ